MKLGVMDYTEGDEVILNFFKTPEAKARHLFLYLTNFPTKLQSRFNHKRSLLHLTVEKRPDLLEQLLSFQTDPPLITLLDQSNRSALHIAAAHGHEQSLKILIRLCPSLINAVDINGQTAVLLAAIQGQYAMVKHLVRAGAIIYQTDVLNVNLTKLSRDNPDLLNALKMDSDPIVVQKVFENPNNELPDEDVKNLIKNFRALKLFNENTFTTRSSHVLPNNSDTVSHSLTPRWHDPTLKFAAITTDTLATLDYASLEQYLSKEGDPYTMVSDQPLLFALFHALSNDKPVQNWESQRRQFLLMLRHALLDRPDSKGRLLLDFVGNDKTYKLLKMARQALEYEALDSNKVMQAQIFELARLVETALFKAGLNHLPNLFEYDVDTLIEGIKFHESKHKEVAQMILEMCNGLPQVSGRCFSAFDTKNIVQGILTMASPTRVLKILNRLWPHLHPVAQLTACFMVKEILEKDIHNSIHIDDRFSDALLEFLNQVSTDFPIHSKDLCEPIIEMNNLKAKQTANVANANFRTLREWLECGALTQHQEKSFDQIIDKENVEEAAHEMRALFMRVSQNLKVSEFYDKHAWSDENSKNAEKKMPPY